MAEEIGTGLDKRGSVMEPSTTLTRRQIAGFPVAMPTSQDQSASASDLAITHVSKFLRCFEVSSNLALSFRFAQL